MEIRDSFLWFFLIFGLLLFRGYYDSSVIAALIGSNLTDFSHWVRLLFNIISDHISIIYEQYHEIRIYKNAATLFSFLADLCVMFLHSSNYLCIFVRSLLVTGAMLYLVIISRCYFGCLDVKFAQELGYLSLSMPIGSFAFGICSVRRWTFSHAALQQHSEICSVVYYYRNR